MSSSLNDISHILCLPPYISVRVTRGDVLFALFHSFIGTRIPTSVIRHHDGYWAIGPVQGMVVPVDAAVSQRSVMRVIANDDRTAAYTKLRSGLTGIERKAKTASAVARSVAFLPAPALNTDAAPVISHGCGLPHCYC